MATIQSATVRYLARFSLGQYQHEELEVCLGPGAEPSIEEVGALLDTARDLVHSKSVAKQGKAVEQVNKLLGTKIPAPQQTLPSANSVVATPQQGLPGVNYRPPVVKPAAAQTATPKHKIPGFYYGYKLPYKKPAAVEAALQQLRNDKYLQWDKEEKMWWSKVIVDGWDNYLVVNAYAAAMNPAPTQQPAPTPIQTVPIEQDYVRGTQDEDEIPF